MVEYKEEINSRFHVEERKKQALSVFGFDGRLNQETGIS